MASDEDPPPAQHLHGLRVLLVGSDDGALEPAADLIVACGGTCTRVAALAGIAAAAAGSDRAGVAVDVIVFGCEFETSTALAVIASLRRKAVLASMRYVVCTRDASAPTTTASPDTTVVGVEPLQSANFLHALVPAVGGSGAVVTPPTIRDKVSRPRILVAEDNAINQEIISAQLDALGYAHEVFDNGQHALAAWQTGRFALILTDCDMPVMDGYEMTARIRALESATGTARVPIIAASANELPSEIDACRVAGMDDYLAKPIEMQHLAQALARWTAPRSDQARYADQCAAPSKTVTEVASAPKPAADTSVLAVFDPHPIYDTIGRDRATIAEFVSMVMNDIQSQVDGIATALARGDAKQAARHAHAIKGTAGAVGAGRVRAMARALDEAGKADDCARCTELIPELGATVAELRDEVAREPW